ncbi:MAG: acetylglutamate kinase [Candidatus Omnitrophota bacterium]
MQEAIRKSAVLIEAFPYIKLYSNKIFVIKYGGSALIDPEIKKRVLQDIVFMSYVGIRPVIVHGGGPFINKEMERCSKNIQFKDGLRVTTKEDIDIVDRVLSEVNQGIANDIKHLGGRAVSLNTTKKDVIKTKPHSKSSYLGHVGEVAGIESSPIRKAVRPRTVPVISPVGIGEDGELYNVNADDVASNIAISLKAAKLVLLTDVLGIMREKGKEETLISSIKMGEAEQFISSNVIQGGMIPKVRSCTNALNGGVSKTHIIDGRIPHSLLLEIFTDKGIGTEIVKAD